MIYSLPWLKYVFNAHIAPLADAPRDARKLVVLEDNARYRTFHTECMANDDLLRPRVVFVTSNEALRDSVLLAPQ